MTAVRVSLDSLVNLASPVLPSDGYVATVTPAEAWVGGRPLLISLNEDGTPLSAPRLVTDGDIKGGRYVSGVYDLARRVRADIAGYGPSAATTSSGMSAARFRTRSA